MTTEALVKPATIQEQLLGKAREMRLVNEQKKSADAQARRAAYQLENIACDKRRLIQCFLDLSEKYFGINDNQMRELTDQEFETLFSLLVKRAKRDSFSLHIVLFSIPLFGWIALLSPSTRSIEFIRSISRLEKNLGNSFNPAQFLDKELRKTTKEVETATQERSQNDN